MRRSKHASWPSHQIRRPSSLCLDHSPLEGRETTYAETDARVHLSRFSLEYSSSRPCPSIDCRRRQGQLWCSAARRHGRSRKRRADRESADSRDRQYGSVPRGRLAARYLLGHVQAHRFQRRPARRNRADGGGDNDGERRSSRRRAVGDDHGHGRNADCGRAKRPPADDCCE